MNKNIWVFDVETFKKMFSYCAINKDTEEIVKFVIHKDKYELPELIVHLKSCKGLIGFNNINFDYPILHYILDNYYTWMFDDVPIEQQITLIYNEAQRIIESQNHSFGFDKFNGIKEKYWKIPQLDLFRMWHFNNSARSTSLKALEISMNYPNVMESSIHHSKDSITLKEVDEILEYNLNDVLATYEFYKKTKLHGKLDLRAAIQSKFGLNCINWNNGKIGEELILKLYCQKTGLDYWETKKLRTKRTSIDLKDCIPKGINFKSKEFNNLLEFFNNKTIVETKNSVDYSVIYKQHKYDFGTGGEHGIHKCGTYLSNDDYIIKSADVASLHPNLPLVFGFYPEHLGKEFLEVYGDNIVKVRLAEKAKPKKEQNKAIVDGYKEAANVPYGKSNEENSFLYDPLYTMKTTIASQLVLSMLCERLSDIPDSQMLMSNTDGCEILIPRIYEDLYNQTCKQWEEETKLVLEFADYRKMWIKDINNYGCVTFDNKVKNKGAFEVDKVIGGEPAYHKDNSFRIVPLALEKYFNEGISIEDTIINHTNIYDFCGRQKFKGEDYGQTHTLIDNKEVIEKQQKNVRYYISNKGSTFIKQYKKGSSEFINKGYQITIFNKYVEKPFGQYDVNYDFYIKECMKIIQVIEDKQLTLL